MRFDYDAQHDSLYLHLANRPGTSAREITDGVIADFDSSGALVGLDIEHASERLDLTTLDVGSLPISKPA